MDYHQFRQSFFNQGIFSTKQIELMFPGFNNDNLLYWQKKEYILKLRNTWYCFKEFLEIPDAFLLISNTIYAPSYISHQEALMFYGMIPEFIVDSTSITTKKTTTFSINNRNYKYYNLKKELFFGYRFLDVEINRQKRKVLFAEPEKALLDYLYHDSINRSPEHIEQLRLNETVLVDNFDWNRLQLYLERFNSKTLTRKIKIIRQIYKI